jgi:hypothetical protein
MMPLTISGWFLPIFTLCQGFVLSMYMPSFLWFKPEFDVKLGLRPPVNSGF